MKGDIMTTECTGRIGLSVAALFAFTFLIGCETQRDTRQPSQSQIGSSSPHTPSQAGSPGQQGTMSGQSPMEHDKAGERMIK
jgi:hypothetical protein